MRRAVVVIPKMLGSCKECGCQCNNCNSNSLDLHHEVEELRSRLHESASRVAQLETQCADGRTAFDGEVGRLNDDLAKLRERYDRLLENNRKLQKLNHELEDKLLRVVNHFDSEKTSLQSDISNTMSKLVDAKTTIVELQKEAERYKNDCSLAVHLLKTNSAQYAEAAKTLPKGVYDRLRASPTPLSTSDTEDDDINSVLSVDVSSLVGDAPSTVGTPRIVHMSTFPPTAMAFSVPPSAPPLASPRQMSQRRRRALALTALIHSYAAPAPGDVAGSSRRLVVCNSCSKDRVVHAISSQTDE